MEVWEWAELCWTGVLAGEGVTETVGMGGERGMEVGGVEVLGPREAGVTPVAAGFTDPTEESPRLTACRYVYSVHDLDT